MNQCEIKSLNLVQQQPIMWFLCCSHPDIFKVFYQTDDNGRGIYIEFDGIYPSFITVQNNALHSNIYPDVYKVLSMCPRDMIGVSNGRRLGIYMVDHNSVIALSIDRIAKIQHVDTIMNSKPYLLRNSVRDTVYSIPILCLG